MFVICIAAQFSSIYSNYACALESTDSKKTFTSISSVEINSTVVAIESDYEKSKTCLQCNHCLTCHQYFVCISDSQLQAHYSISGESDFQYKLPYSVAFIFSDQKPPIN